MKIALASDHAGYAEKERLKPLLINLVLEVEDLGTDANVLAIGARTTPPEQFRRSCALGSVPPSKAGATLTASKKFAG